MSQSLNPGPDEVAVVDLPQAAEVPPEIRPVHDEVMELRCILEEIRDLAAPLREPAQLTTVPLTATERRKRLPEIGLTTASIAILNPTGVPVLLGIGGGAATSQDRAIAIPPESLLVLPVSAGEVEIGTEAELGSDTAIVHVFRYRSVQPAFLGSV
jgi:hypothetical protein